LVLRSFEPTGLGDFAAVLADERTMAAWGGPYDARRAERGLADYLDHEQR
jgi:hypothetical protein